MGKYDTPNTQEFSRLSLDRNRELFHGFSLVYILYTILNTLNEILISKMQFKRSSLRSLATFLFVPSGLCTLFWEKNSSYRDGSPPPYIYIPLQVPANLHIMGVVQMIQRRTMINPILPWFSKLRLILIFLLFSYTNTVSGDQTQDIHLSLSW